MQLSFTKQDSNIVKTVAIILMYIHHSFFSQESYAGYTVNFTPFGEADVISFAQVCKICVALFVFISAYGICVSFNKGKSKPEKCYINLYKENFCRYIKLLSAFILIYIIAQLFSLLGRSNQEVYGTGLKKIFFMILDFMGLANIFGTPTFNPTWWYMGMAVTIFCIMPIIWNCTKKAGAACLIVSVIVPRMLGIGLTELTWWLPTICLGALAAEYNLIVKCREYKKEHMPWRIGKIMLTMCVLVGFGLLRSRTTAFYDITDMVMAGSIVYLCFELFGGVSEKAKKILGFTGAYSMNMFLMHTFVRGYYFKAFSYSFKYPIIILAVLVIDTLLFSVCLEWMKNVSGYNKAVSIICSRCLHWKG